MGTMDIPGITDYMINLRKIEFFKENFGNDEFYDIFGKNINKNETDQKFTNKIVEKFKNKNPDKILNIINKISYLGHSQGTAQFFAGFSRNPEYFKKNFNGMIALGPVTTLKYFSSSLIKQFSDKKVERIYDFFRINEVFDSKNSVNKFNKFLCDIIPIICKGGMELIVDEKSSNNDENKFLVWVSHYPSGTSSKNIGHFSKILREKNFEDYDGVNYDLSLIDDFPISLHVGKDDRMSTVEDSRELREILIENNSLYFYKL